MKVILSQPWGGLGDNLQFTTLPHYYYLQGDDFYINSDNSYRNDEIYDMVWKSNPYVKGITDEPANVGYPSKHAEVCHMSIRNVIKSWELVHGFDSGKDMFPPPVLYHIPKMVDAARGKIVVDFGTITFSGKYNKDKVLAFMEDNFNVEDLLLLKRKGNPTFHNSFNEKVVDRVIEYETYHDYLDILSSCKGVYCFSSGTNAVAAALNKYKMIDVHCVYHVENFDPSWPGYFFSNVTYHEI